MTTSPGSAPPPATHALARLARWIADHAEGFWLTRGIDRATGLPHESLRADGSGRGDDLRVRVLARQLFVFARWEGHNPAARPLAAGLLDQLVTRACHPEGGFVHILSRQGRVIDSRRDLYDHAFILLALGALRAGTRGAEVDPLIDATLAFLDRNLADTGKLGRYLDGLDASGTALTMPRRQNPHMHLLEALLMLRAAGRDDLDARIAALLESFRTCFMSPDGRHVIETFDAGWQRFPDAQRWEPGHSFEWVWLLACAGMADRPICLDLIRHGLKEGLCPETGLVRDAVPHGAGDPPPRLWPQIEALKALFVAETLWPDAASDVAPTAARLGEALFTTYLDNAGRHDDRPHRPGSGSTGPVLASTVYHLQTAAEAPALLALAQDAAKPLTAIRAVGA